MLRVKHHAQIQQLCLLPGKLPVRSQSVEDGLGGGVVGLVGVEKHALLVKMTPLHLIGVRHDGGHPRDEGQTLAHVVFQRLIIGIVVVGIQCQHRTSQLVHDILGRRLDNHILGEILGQFPVLVEDLADPIVLTPVGQLAENQKPNHFLEAKTILRFAAPNDIFHVNSPIGELALVRDLITVGDEITVNITHVGQARHDASAIGVAQAPLHPVGLIFFFGNDVVPLIFFAQLLNGGAAGRFIVEPLHNASPFFKR